VSLRKAVLKDEDRARVSELQAWRDCTRTLFAVLPPPEPSQHHPCLYVLLMEELLPSSLSQLAWLGKESRAVRETVTWSKEHVEGNRRTSVVKPLSRGLSSSWIQNSPKWHSSLCTFLVSVGLQQKRA